ncbi:MAG: hypothetical protein LC650_00295 [Actinobacteria bacterium]|nr:hypothetical protein [Actinomycetota bacterium]
MYGFILNGSLEIDTQEFLEWLGKGDLMEFLREFTNGCVAAEAEEIKITMLPDGKALVEFRTESE